MNRNNMRTVFCGLCRRLSILIVLILCLSMIVSGCGKKKGDSEVVQDENTDITVSDDTQEIVTDNSDVAKDEEEKVEEEEVQIEEEPVVSEPVMLPDMAEHYAINPDICGWLWIDDTKLNYPVMYTPDQREKYLHLDFNEQYNVGGLPFLDEDCSLDPESDNLIIYGHNMINGTQFNTIMNYADESYWEEHPNIYFSTLYETRTYEIIACFYDRVYYKYEDVFKFYQFIDAADEAEFENAMANYKEKALYDTGVTAEYGDGLITLVTCAYHTENGRFVVVGRYIDE